MGGGHVGERGTGAMSEHEGRRTEARANRSHADAVVERAARELLELLPRAARAVGEFPSFPGAMFACAIEVDPAGELPGDYGCVVLGEDGGLYELVVSHDPQQEAAGDPVATRAEELRPLEGMPPEHVVLYAHGAVLAALRHVEHPAAPA